jgi:hypothetical protein
MWVASIINHSKSGSMTNFSSRLFPQAFISPTAEASMGILPISQIGRQITPGTAGAQNPEDGVEKKTIVVGSPAPLAFLPWQVWGQQSPGGIREIVASMRRQRHLAYSSYQTLR